MSCYVPNYLTFHPRQADGWPAFVSEGTKTWCLDRVCDLVAGWPRDHVGLDDIREAIFLHPDRPGELRGVALWDAQYAVAHRAALAADLTQVWTSRRN